MNACLSERASKQLFDGKYAVLRIQKHVQTDMASEVAGVMQDILKITVQTTEGTRLTANSRAIDRADS